MKRRPRPDEPPADLTWCIKCRKVIGTERTRGYFGAECQCDRGRRPSALGPSVGTLRAPPKPG